MNSWYKMELVIYNVSPVCTIVHVRFTMVMATLLKLFIVLTNITHIVELHNDSTLDI